jgi:6-phosphogluconolactonase
MLAPMSALVAMRASAVTVLLGLLATLAPGCAGRQVAPRKGPPGPTPHTFVFVGTSAGQIAILELDEALGDLTPRGRHVLGAAPVALAARGDRNVLVAVLGKGATVLSLAIDAQTGALTSKGRAPSGGQQPAGATLDGTGKYALVTHQGSGSVAVLAIKPDGSLHPAEVFAAAKGADGVAVHPSNQVAFVANHRAGTLSQFSFNAGTGVLTPKSDAAGALPRDYRPRQVACHPGGRIIYVLNEANHSISAHAFDDRMGTLSRMALQVIGTRSEPGGGRNDPAGELRVAVGGGHVYATDPGQDRLTTFAVDPGTGDLSLVDRQPTGGEGPHGLAVDPLGHFLVVANRKSQSLTVFRLDERTGRAVSLGQTKVVGSPTALVVVRPLPS